MGDRELLIKIVSEEIDKLPNTTIHAMKIVDEFEENKAITEVIDAIASIDQNQGSTYTYSF